jgi:hypothetical protein
MFQGIFKGLLFTTFFVGGAFALRFYFDREFTGENGWWIDYAIWSGIIFFFYFSLYMVRRLAHRKDIAKDCDPKGKDYKGKLYDNMIICPLVRWMENDGIVARVVVSFLLTTPIFLATFLEWYNGQEEFTLEIVIFVDIFAFFAFLLFPKVGATLWSYTISPFLALFWVPVYVIVGVYKDWAGGKYKVPDEYEKLDVERDLYKKIKDNK